MDQEVILVPQDTVALEERVDFYFLFQVQWSVSTCTRYTIFVVLTFTLNRAPK